MSNLDVGDFVRWRDKVCRVIKIRDDEGPTQTIDIERDGEMFTVFSLWVICAESKPKFCGWGPDGEITKKDGFFYSGGVIIGSYSDLRTSKPENEAYLGPTLGKLTPEEEAESERWREKKKAKTEHE